MTFFLQHLPDLALAEVVKCMDAFSMLTLTQTSIKTMNHVKYTIKKSKMNMLIHSGDNNQTISLYQNEDASVIDVTLTNDSSELNDFWWIGKNRVPVGFHNDILFTYWFDQNSGYKSLIDFFQDIFRIEFISLNAYTASTEEPYRILEYLRDRKANIGRIEWQTTHSLTADRLEGVLKVASTGMELAFRGANGNWDPEITVENLCGLVNCSDVFMENIELNPRSVNRFLKYWIQNHGNIEQCVFETTNVVAAIVALDGIDSVDVGGLTHQIRRSDNVIFEVYMNGTRFRLAPKVID